MKTDKQGVTHLSETEIVERGWTKAGVRKFLGDPDWSPSFHAYGKTMQWRLYREDRVVEFEATDVWKEWRAKSEKRRVSARAAAAVRVAEEEARRAAELEEYKKEVREIPVRFTGQLPSLEKLRVLGEKNWVPSPNPDPSFKETTEEHSDRVTVNYIRHHLTNYDDILYDYHIVDEGYLIITRKIHDLIAKRFPELKASCEQRVAYAERRTAEYEAMRAAYRYY